MGFVLRVIRKTLASGPGRRNAVCLPFGSSSIFSTLHTEPTIPLTVSSWFSFLTYAVNTGLWLSTHFFRSSIWVSSVTSSVWGVIGKITSSCIGIMGIETLFSPSSEKSMLSFTSVMIDPIISFWVEMVTGRDIADLRIWFANPDAKLAISHLSRKKSEEFS